MVIHCLLKTEVLSALRTPEKGPVWFTGVMMDSDPPETSLLPVRALLCGVQQTHEIIPACLLEVRPCQLCLYNIIFCILLFSYGEYNYTSAQQLSPKYRMSRGHSTIYMLCPVQQ